MSSAWMPAGSAGVTAAAPDAPAALDPTYVGIPMAAAPGYY